MTPEDPHAEEFFIGWQSKLPKKTRAEIIRFLFLGFLVFPAVAFACAYFQQTIGVGVYEWGSSRKFTGYLAKDPYPHLLVSRGAGGASASYSAYPLVAPAKFGFEQEWCAPLDNQPVDLEGTLIYNGNTVFIETDPKSILPSAQELPPVERHRFSLGNYELVGEIVDSKCYFGAMNPGHLKTHRACAQLCIRGGIPPFLIITGGHGQHIGLLLTGENGEMINEAVIPFVAQPVRLYGEVVRHDDLLVYRINPKRIQRLHFH